ncbi:MAG TPA: hypothetical protein VHW00_13135 [Thermoanaerobaculia bacterium]|nr:hypothetical protein [Thermoanaerobaculia bacterium]
MIEVGEIDSTREVMRPSPKLSRLINQTHLAVVSGAAGQDRYLDLARPEIFGTAFPLAPSLGLFCTALHVYQQAAEYAASQQNGLVVVGRIMGSPEQSIPVADREEFPGIDFVILKCPGLQVPRLDFDFTPLDYLSEIVACGFPFGVTLTQGGPPVKYLRAFSGTVVTRRGLTEFPLVPPGYETSFVPPPGLSGAPLLTIRDGVAIRGVILREHVVELGHAPERKMMLGIALDIEELLTLNSRLAGGSVAKILFGREPLDRGERTP